MPSIQPSKETCEEFISGAARVQAAMIVLAKLVLAGVNPELVAEVAQAILDARLAGSAAPVRTARQDRNARYYASKNLNKTPQDASETHKTPDKTVSDDQDASTSSAYIETKTLSSDPKGSSVSLSADQPKIEVSIEAKPKREKRKSRIDPNRELTPADLGYCDKKTMDHVTATREHERFKTHHTAKGTLMVDWHAAWCTWVQNWESNLFGRPRDGPEKSEPKRNPYFALSRNHQHEQNPCEHDGPTIEADTFVSGGQGGNRNDP